MAYRSISAANLSQIPAGTRVKFNYGAMHGSELGTVTGSRVGRFGASLTAITDDGETKDIHGFGNVGVGVYLIDERLSAVFLGE